MNVRLGTAFGVGIGLVVATFGSVASPAQAASGPWSVVAAGQEHTCAVNAGRSLYCWGFNNLGQVGDGSTTQRVSPTKIGASGVWAGVSGGVQHTCAISTGKSLYCWGDNGNGQVGDASTTQRVSPRKVGSTGVWAAVSVGGFHTCAITTGKSLYCWGYNGFGQVGDGTFGTDRLSPRKVGSTGVWAGVSAGRHHSCAISTGRSLYCWGNNGNGQIGDGTTTSPRPAPKKVGANGVWAQADAGDNHTCAVTSGRSLYCWGYNLYGQVGDGTSGTDRPSPKKIGTSGVWARVSAGGGAQVAHTCAVSTGRSLYCWGYNGTGQVGDGTTTSPRPSPRKVGTSGVWAAAAAGGLHSCAISTGKSLYCWGYNITGQVGDGTTTSPRPSPKKIP